jgi:hypothetical protein
VPSKPRKGVKLHGTRIGIDVHKVTLVTTIITEEWKETKWSGVGAGDLKNLMEWLKEKKCLKGVNFKTANMFTQYEQTLTHKKTLADAFT